MRIILKRYRLDGPRPAAIASRAKPWIPSSRVYTRGRTWSRPHARGARCGARGGKPRRAWARRSTARWPPWRARLL